MKTLVILVGVLAITTVGYGLNIDRLRKYNSNFKKCSEELGESISEPSAKTVRCALARDGQIFDTNGKYIKENALQALEDTISDEGKLNQAKTIFNKCYNDALKGGSTVDKQTMEIVECTLAIASLLDKLN
uniref:Venom allergen 2 n=1 Tax=Odontomachus monticola TaxID=613454 RepID=A0A348G5X5_ODOMO